MGYIGIGFDNHEQKLAQDSLKQSENNLNDGRINAKKYGL
jgi:hypothetical protein